MRLRALSRRTAAAFSLIELLVVVSIIVTLMVFVAPAFNQIGRASNITAAGSGVADQLKLARQTALAQNRIVEVRFYKIPGEAGGREEYRAMRTVMYDEEIRYDQPMGRVLQMPPGIILTSETEFSTILSGETNPRETKSDTMPGDTVKRPYHYIRFRPTGATDLSPGGANGDKWFLTVKAETEQPVDGKPASNYVTVMLDPVAGTVRVFRP